MDLKLFYSLPQAAAFRERREKEKNLFLGKFANGWMVAEADYRRVNYMYSALDRPNVRVGIDRLMDAAWTAPTMFGENFIVFRTCRVWNSPKVGNGQQCY